MSLKWKSLLIKAVYILIQPLFLPVVWRVDFQSPSWPFWYGLAAFLYTLDAVLLLLVLKSK